MHGYVQWVTSIKLTLSTRNADTKVTEVRRSIQIWIAKRIFTRLVARFLFQIYTAKFTLAFMK